MSTPIFNKTFISILATTILSCFASYIVVDLIKAEDSYLSDHFVKENLARFETNQFDTSRFTYQILNEPNKKFGYNIYKDKQLLIHQPSIPALPGNDGFEAKADAIKVAQLVIDKLKHGEMPPSVSIDEMIRLKVKLKSAPKN